MGPVTDDFFCGCAAYRTMAPEVIRHGKYSETADTFSFAMLVNQLFTEETPYEFLIPLEAAVGVVKRGLRPSTKKVKSPRVRDLIVRCWDQEPSARPGWDHVLQELEKAREESEGGRRLARSIDGAEKGGSAAGKPGIGSLFRKLGSGGGIRSTHGRKREDKDKVKEKDKSKAKVSGHNLPMDTEHEA